MDSEFEWFTLGCVKIKANGRDTDAGLNYSLEMQIDDMGVDLYDSFVCIINSIANQIGWRTVLCGDIDRIKTVICEITSDLTELSYSISNERKYLIHSAEIYNSKKWHTKISNEVLSPNKISEFLNISDKLHYDKIFFRWENAVSWVIDGNGTFSDLDNYLLDDKSIELVINKRRKSEIYFALNDNLPKKKIKSSIESILNKKLKNINFWVCDSQEAFQFCSIWVLSGGHNTCCLASVGQAAGFEASVASACGARLHDGLDKVIRGRGAAPDRVGSG